MTRSRGAVHCSGRCKYVAQALGLPVDIFTVSKNPILPWSWVIGRPLSVGALLLPLLATADSQLNVRTVNGAYSATAHLDFKIIIPKVLSLDLGPLGLENGNGGQPCGTRTVAIRSNSRHAMLSATAGLAANTHRMTCTVSMP